MENKKFRNSLVGRMQFSASSTYSGQLEGATVTGYSPLPAEDCMSLHEFYLQVYKYFIKKMCAAGLNAH